MGAGHTLAYVENDSRKALRMVKPGGFIVCHDYLGRRVKEVFEALNEMSREVDIRAFGEYVLRRLPRATAGIVANVGGERASLLKWRLR